MLLFLSAASCSYSFILDGKTSGQKFLLEPSANATSLIQGGMVLDANLERVLSSMGMLASEISPYTLHSTLASYTNQAITSTSLSTSDRYRLLITVTVRITNSEGKEIWRMSFTDTGTYAEGGQAENALEEASRRVSEQIGRALASLTL